MTVYVIVDNQVHNPEAYKEYLALITPTVAAYGGRYLVRAGKIHLTDSEWRPDRLVVMAFDTAEQATTWVNSPEIAHIHAMRRANATSKLIVIDGADVVPTSSK
jgi:uncharacterized protein (DUF1330 family)